MLIDIPYKIDPRSGLYVLHQELYALYLTPDITRNFIWSVDPLSGDDEPRVIVRAEEYLHPIETMNRAIPVPLSPLGSRWFFVLRADPKRSMGEIKKKRFLRDNMERLIWLVEQGRRRGFEVDVTTVSIKNRRYYIRRIEKYNIPVDDVVFSGFLEVRDEAAFGKLIQWGMGKSKGLGFGLMQIFPHRIKEIPAYQRSMLDIKRSEGRHHGTL